jgi:hypothetical protein
LGLTVAILHRKSRQDFHWEAQPRRHIDGDAVGTIAHETALYVAKYLTAAKNRLNCAAMAVRGNADIVGREAPTPIHSGAAENLRYIRSTIEAANTFTTVPGKGCVAMGVAALAAAALELVPRFAAHWLPIWLTAAVISCTVALFFMEAKARAQGLSLRRSVAWRFFLTLAPAFVAGGILTVALIDEVGRGAVAGIWLLMYGTGVAACGVFSIPVVLIAGFAFMGLGTVTLAAPESWAPMMLALGFGGLHLLLGALIWRDHGG